LTEVHRGTVGAGSLIERPRLTALLDQITQRRLTLVVAGAGYGKSTLLRRWADERRVAWVAAGDAALGEDETGSLTLVGPILDAVAAAGIVFPETIDDRAAGAETQAGLIARAIEASGVDELTLMIDDLHDRPAELERTGLVAALVRQVPSTVHVVLSTRSAPRFPIQRLRARGEALELGIRDLAMDPFEVDHLLERILGSSDPPLATKLVEATGGWPALIRLALEALRPLAASARVAAIDHLVGSGEAIFPYVAEEVLGAEPAPVRELVRRVAPLDTFDADLCTELGIADAAVLIEDLRSRGLFIAAASGPGQRVALHSLVREYILRREPAGASELAHIRATGARWLSRSGDAEAALALAVAAADTSLTIEVLRSEGEGWLRRGRVDGIVAAIRALPTEARTDELSLLLGDALNHRGDREGALTEYRRVARRRPLAAAVAWRLGRLHFEGSEFRRAAEVLRGASLEGAADRDRARLLAWRAMSAWHADEPDATFLALQAREVAASSGDPGAVSIAATAACFSLLKSDLAAARLHHAAALRSADESDDVVQRVRLRCAIEVGYASLPEIAAELTRVLPAVEAAGQLRFLGRAHQSRGLCLLQLGRYDEAEADLRRALEINRKLDRADFGAWMLLGDLNRIRGDLAVAAGQYERALASSRDDRDYAAWAMGGIARMVARTEPERATALIDDAMTKVLPHHRHVLELDAGWVCVATGRVEEASRYARSVMASASAEDGGDLPVRLASALELAAVTAEDVGQRRSHLEQAASIWRRLGNDAHGAIVALALAYLDTGPRARAAQAAALARIRSAGIRPSAADAACLLGNIPRHEQPALQVRTFGTFQVLRDGVPVPIAEWKSKKSRDLLKILVARGTSVARDELVEALWPDEPAEATANRLSVALSLLRAVLDPDRRHAADAFVTTDRGATRLATEALGVDYTDFMIHASEGLSLHERGQNGEALESLMAAEATYAGDLFEEDAYADWAIGPREQARGLYVQTARAIAEILAARGDDDAAARYLRRVVARDPFDEPAHLGLVRALARARHHGEARRAYESYVARMAYLEIEPAAYPAV
jgi:ATP/maltotriose-dependent transcriptional regulator MalT/DNA-binding SARP family transcriptional activator